MNLVEHGRYLDLHVAVLSAVHDLDTEAHRDP